MAIDALLGLWSSIFKVDWKDLSAEFAAYLGFLNYILGAVELRS
jgi:hypothetical protein